MNNTTNRINSFEVNEIKAEVFDIWKQAVEYFNNISEVLHFMPRVERYKFRDQVSVSALSVVNQIARGSNSRTRKELQSSLKRAMDSLEATVATLFLARQYRCLRRDLFDAIYFHGALLAKKMKRIDMGLGEMPYISKN